MNYQKILAAVSELRDAEAQLVIAHELKTEAQERMLRDDPYPTDREWHQAASEYAFANADMNRIAARIRVLKGRVHFHAKAA